MVCMQSTIPLLTIMLGACASVNAPRDDDELDPKGEDGSSGTGEDLLGEDDASDETGTDADPECPPGTEGCSCEVNGQCDPGLGCDLGLCTPRSDGACGDARLDADEECDLGAANIDTGACKTDCTLQRCGDGFVGPGEACDDANDDDTDTCTSGCVFPRCGDGVVQEPEQCDDDNDDDGDGCLSSCVLATCGDGYVWTGVEECDDGNDIDTDDCNEACELVVDSTCSNGAVEPGELCFQHQTADVLVTRPSDAVVTDVTGDGHLDLVVLSLSENRVLVQEGDGQGGWSGARLLPPPTVGTTALHAPVLVAADLNRDGHVDLINSSSSLDELIIHHGTGSSNLFGTPTFVPTIGRAPAKIAVGDFDGSQTLRMLIGTESADAAGNYQVQVHPGPSKGDADFAPTEVAAGDLDGDGIQEAIVIDRNQSLLRIFSVGSTIEPQHEVELSQSPLIMDVAAADLDGDGADEIVYVHNGQKAQCSSPDNCLPGRVVVMAGAPGDLTTFGTALQYVVGLGPLRLAIEDMNADGHLDLITVNAVSQDLAIALGSERRPFTEVERLPLNHGVGAASLAVGDLDEDGIPELVVPLEQHNNVRILWSTP